MQLANFINETVRVDQNDLLHRFRHSRYQNRLKSVLESEKLATSDAFWFGTQQLTQFVYVNLLPQILTDEGIGAIQSIDLVRGVLLHFASRSALPGTSTLAFGNASYSDLAFVAFEKHATSTIFAMSGAEAVTPFNLSDKVLRSENRLSLVSGTAAETRNLLRPRSVSTLFFDLTAEDDAGLHEMAELEEVLTDPTYLVVRGPTQSAGRLQSLAHDDGRFKLWAQCFVPTSREGGPQDESYVFAYYDLRPPYLSQFARLTRRVHVSVGQFERAPDRTSSGPFRFSHASEIASCAAESREYFGERTIEFANPEALYLPEDAPTIWRGQFGKEAVDWLYMKDFACSPLRHYRFNNLRVMGSVTCITEDNQIFDGQLRPFDESSFLALAGLHHSDMRQGANGQIVSERAQQPPTFVPGKTLLLPDGGLPMHYHFLYDFLPRLWIRQQPEFADLKVAVPNLIDLPEVGILNDFYGVPTSDLLIYDVEGPGTVFESAYLVPNFTTDYWTMPEVIEMPRRALTLATAPKSEKLRNARKIYVSRRNIKHPRHLINEDELVRQLEKLGFVEVFPDEHSYAEEMYIFNNADVVVGVFGSGMANTIFCRKGTKVLILQPDSCNWRGLSFPMKFLELHYGYHFGNSFRRLERFHNTEWLVNIEAVAAQIQAWET